MTALKKFQRLEATGLWRANADAQRREVIVSLGDATLTLSAVSGEILAHWSLGAVTRANGSELPAIYHPDADETETLEISEDESDMIAGLERLMTEIDRRRPHPGKLRFWLSGAFVAVVACLALFWLPGALERYATGVVPPIKRAEIGSKLLHHVNRLTGQPCSAPEAREALLRFFRPNTASWQCGDLARWQHHLGASSRWDHFVESQCGRGFRRS